MGRRASPAYYGDSRQGDAVTPTHAGLFPTPRPQMVAGLLLGASVACLAVAMTRSRREGPDVAPFRTVPTPDVPTHPIPEVQPVPPVQAPPPAQEFRPVQEFLPVRTLPEAPAG